VNIFKSKRVNVPALLPLLQTLLPYRSLIYFFTDRGSVTEMSSTTLVTRTFAKNVEQFSKMLTTLSHAMALFP